MKIRIVGGGTAGYTTALILKTRYPKYNISIVKSDKIGIIGVGEGSTEQWKQFIDYVGIDFKDLIKECDATIKGGIMFEGWGEDRYFHNISPLENLEISQHKIGYLNLIVNNSDKLSLNHLEFIDGHLPQDYNFSDPPANQFHFNTFKLNTFLHKKAVERGIEVFEDEILNVEIYEGNIVSAVAKRRAYDGDFFIDCTGFSRMLIGKLGAKWNSYGKYLKMKEAIAFPTEDTDDYEPWTLAKRLKHGWMWRIPTYGRWGNGYVYDGSITPEEAKQEVENVLGYEIEIGKHVKFDPGCIDKVWINNCVAVGLSANFVEPLEATSIGTTINQVFLLTHYLDNYNKTSIIEYNEKVNSIMENIRDFIVLHYMSEDIEIPDTLKYKLDKWQTRLPIAEDFTESNYLLFGPSNFIQVLYGLNLININNMKKLYNSFSDDIKDFVDKQIQNRRKGNLIKHKEYLNIVRRM